MFKKLLFLVTLLMAVAVGAQTTTSAISGVVNAGEQTLPGANVVAVHTPTGTTYGAITNFDGRFNLFNLRVRTLYNNSKLCRFSSARIHWSDS